MFFAKLRLFAQAVGFVTIGVLMFYGSIGIFQNTNSALGFSDFAPQTAALNNTFNDAIPTIISYQGTLRDAEGKPMSGIYKMVFRIYKDVTAPLPEAIWTEEHAEVTVRDGQFSVLLGGLKPLLPEVFHSPDRFIGITVDELDEMVPRQRFAAVPYAMMAGGATYVTASNGRPSKSVSVNEQGTVVIEKSTHDGDLEENPEGVLTIKDARNTLVLDGSEIRSNGLSLNTGGTNLYLNANSPGAVMIGSGQSPVRLNYQGGEVEIGGSVMGKTDLKVYGNVLVNSEKPILIKRMTAINLSHGKVSISTKIDARQYNCVVTGWSAEGMGHYPHNIKAITTRINNNEWSVRADLSIIIEPLPDVFDVDVLCFLKEISEWRNSDYSD